MPWPSSCRTSEPGGFGDHARLSSQPFWQCVLPEVTSRCLGCKRRAQNHRPGEHRRSAHSGRLRSTSTAPEKAGLAVNERGFITVNDRLETNVPGIFALGDVSGGPPFTHVSYDDFRVVKSAVGLRGRLLHCGANQHPSNLIRRISYPLLQKKSRRATCQLDPRLRAQRHGRSKLPSAALGSPDFDRQPAALDSATRPVSSNPSLYSLHSYDGHTPLV